MEQSFKRKKVTKESTIDDIASSIMDISESVKSIGDSYKTILKINKAVVLFMHKLNTGKNNEITGETESDSEQPSTSVEH